MQKQSLITGWLIPIQTLSNGNPWKTPSQFYCCTWSCMVWTINIALLVRVKCPTCVPRKTLVHPQSICWGSRVKTGECLDTTQALCSKARILVYYTTHAIVKKTNPIPARRSTNENIDQLALSAASEGLTRFLYCSSDLCIVRSSVLASKVVTIAAVSLCKCRCRSAWIWHYT